MNYKSHMIGGIITSTISLILIYLFTDMMTNRTELIYPITVFIFSLYPDLDTASKPSRHYYIIGILLFIYLVHIYMIFSSFLVILFITLPKMFPHRGFVHTIRFSIISGAIYYGIIYNIIDVEFKYIMASVVIGYLTHLTLDKHIKL